MSGTSIDGIDVALIETEGAEVVALGPSISVPYEVKLRSAIRGALGELEGSEEVEQALTNAHVAAVRDFCATTATRLNTIDVIGFHGHTLSHRPDIRRTRQIGDADCLARVLGIDVVSDFRRADVEAGGQGAPLAPIYHLHLLRYRAHAGDDPLPFPVAVLNVGGVANLTFIDEGAFDEAELLLAFDTGPGNALIDDWMLARTGEPYDRDGSLAARGRIDQAVVKSLLDRPYFTRKPPKSLDRQYFEIPDSFAGSPADGAATLTAFSVASVAEAVKHLPERPRCWLVTGGGRHNHCLVDQLAARLAVPVLPIEAAGGRGDSLEAEAFAYMAVRVLRGLPISFPRTTGVPKPMTGGAVCRAPS